MKNNSRQYVIKLYSQKKKIHLVPKLHYTQIISIYILVQVRVTTMTTNVGDEKIFIVQN